jgi:hypothetical protein
MFSKRFYMIEIRDNKLFFETDEDLIDISDGIIGGFDSLEINIDDVNYYSVYGEEIVILTKNEEEFVFLFCDEQKAKEAEKIMEENLG